MRPLLVIALLSVLSIATSTAQATETRVTVRVLAHDAKLIGDAAGGCAITIRDAATGRILAEGIQTGGTGNTDKIIREPWIRGQARLNTDGAAGFTTTLDIARPTRVIIEARGPLGFRTSEFSTSRTLLLLPGHHIEGDGIVLELQGLIVNLQEPDPEDQLEPGSTIEIEAGVKLLCTCPINVESLWAAADYRVSAELWENGSLLVAVPLLITERNNVFAGSVALPDVEEGKKRVLELRVNAANSSTSNFGSDSTVFRLER
jgi:hypothetical protein